MFHTDSRPLKGYTSGLGEGPRIGVPVSVTLVAYILYSLLNRRFLEERNRYRNSCEIFVGFPCRGVVSISLAPFISVSFFFCYRALFRFMKGKKKGKVLRFHMIYSFQIRFLV